MKNNKISAKKDKNLRRKRPRMTPMLHSAKPIKPTSKYNPAVEDAKHKKENE